MEQFIQSYTMLTQRNRNGGWLYDDDKTRTPEMAAVVSNTFLLECASPTTSEYIVSIVVAS